jgi:hypothetical protein
MEHPEHGDQVHLTRRERKALGVPPKERDARSEIETSPVQQRAAKVKPHRLPAFLAQQGQEFPASCSQVQDPPRAPAADQVGHPGQQLGVSLPGLLRLQPGLQPPLQIRRRTHVLTLAGPSSIMKAD